MPKWRMWVAVLAVFACGLVLGAVAGSLYERHAALSHIARIRADRGASLAQMTLDRLQRDLNLEPEQSAAAKTLLEKSFARIHQLHEDLRPQMDKVLEEAAGQLKQGLKPEQAKRLEEMGGWRALLPPLPKPGGPPHPPRGGPGGPGGPPPPGFGPPPFGDPDVPPPFGGPDVPPPFGGPDVPPPFGGPDGPPPRP